MMQQFSRMEVVKLESNAVTAFKVVRFQGTFASIPARGKAASLHLSVLHEDLSTLGV